LFFKWVAFYTSGEIKLGLPKSAGFGLPKEIKGKFAGQFSEALRLLFMYSNFGGVNVQSGSNYYVTP